MKDFLLFGVTPRNLPVEFRGIGIESLGSHVPALPVEVSPQLLRWACERAGKGAITALRERFKHLDAWISGARQPTLKELEAFAKATHVSVGYFFLDEPPKEPLPIRDL